MSRVISYFVLFGLLLSTHIVYAQTLPPGMIADINLGAESSLNINDQILPLNRNRFIFAAKTVNHGIELWISNTTERATYMVKDLVPGPSSSYPLGFVKLGANKAIFFTCNLESLVGNCSQPTLWVTDTTGVGTVALKTFIDFPYFYIRPSTANAGKVYFAANDGQGRGSELWVTDGTTAGTMLLKDINAGISDSIPKYFMTFQNRVVFSASAPSSLAGGAVVEDLWITDGTASGTYRIRQLASTTNSNPLPAAVLPNGSALIFSIYTASYGKEVWKTDGTFSGTQLVRDIYPGLFNSYPQHFIAYNNELYFFAKSDSTPYGDLWKTDGTTAGTNLVAYLPEYYSAWPVAHQNHLYFLSDQGLWQSDGTQNGTVMIENAYYPYYLYSVGDYLYYRNIGDVFRTSGQTPFLAQPVSSFPIGSEPTISAIVDDQLIVPADIPGYGRELHSIK